MSFCLITLGKVINRARRDFGMSQKELASVLSYYSPIDYRELSRIENNRIDVRDRSYDWLIKALGELFRLDVNWLEQIRKQTEPQPLNLETTISVFPIYLNVYDLLKSGNK